MYKNYLKTYQDEGEVKLTFDEWCTQNGGGLCESDLTKAQEAYAQYSDDFDIKGIQFNKSDNNSDPNSVKFNNTISAEEKIFNAPNRIIGQNFRMSNPYLLSSVGDNPFLDFVGAVGESINYWKDNDLSKRPKPPYPIDPTGKFLINAELQGLYPNDPVKFMQTPDEYDEWLIQRELDYRAEMYPDLYAKQKVDLEDYRKTGNLNFVNPNQPMKLGDRLEVREYPDAEYINYDDSGNPVSYYKTVDGELQEFPIFTGPIEMETIPIDPNSFQTNIDFELQPLAPYDMTDIYGQPSFDINAENAGIESDFSEIDDELIEERYGGSLPKAQSKGEIDLNLLNIGDCTGGGCRDTGDTSTGISLFTGLEGSNKENALIQAGLKGGVTARNSSNFGFSLTGEAGFQNNLKDLLINDPNPSAFHSGKLNIGYKNRPLFMGNQQYPGDNIGLYGEYDSNYGISTGIEGGFGPLNIQAGYNFNSQSPYVGGSLKFNLKDGGGLPIYQDDGSLDVEVHGDFDSGDPMTNPDGSPIYFNVEKSDYVPEPPGGYKNVPIPKDNVNRRGEIITVGNREYPISGYGEGDVPYITTDYGSPEHRHLYNTLNLLDEVQLIDKDPVKEYAEYLRQKHGNDSDWMNIPYERSNKNTAYLRRQQLTNPVFNAVVDPLYGDISGLQSIDRLSELGYNAIPYMMAGAVLPGSQTRLGQLGYRGFQGLMNTKVPMLGTVGQGLNLYGGVYGAANAPGHVEELIEDGPSFRTIGNLGLDAFGMGIGGFQTAKYLNQAKGSLPNFIKPFNYGNKGLKIDKPQLIAPAGTTGPPSSLGNVDEMLYGKYKGLKGQQVLDDYVARIQSPEGQTRLRNMLNEELIGPGKLWDKIPTSGRELTSYNSLIANTLDDFNAGAKELKLLNLSPDGMKTSIGQFDYNKFGLPRISINPNIPHDSKGLGPMISHETGHFTQGVFNNYLKNNLAKINPSYVNPGSRQTLLNKIKPGAPRMTQLDQFLGKNFKLQDPDFYTSIPRSNIGNLDDFSNLTGNQLDEFLTNINYNMGTDDAYNYFARALDKVKNPITGKFDPKISSTNPLGTSREPLGYLSELRQGMQEAGYLKNPYQITSADDIANYYKNFINKGDISLAREFSPRLLQFGDLSMPNLNVLSSAMNKLPATIPIGVAAGAAGTYGPVDQSGNYRYGGMLARAEDGEEFDADADPFDFVTDEGTYDEDMYTLGFNDDISLDIEEDQSDNTEYYNPDDDVEEGNPFNTGTGEDDDDYSGYYSDNVNMDNYDPYENMFDGTNPGITTEPSDGGGYTVQTVSTDPDVYYPGEGEDEFTRMSGSDKRKIKRANNDTTFGEKVLNTWDKIGTTAVTLAKPITNYLRDRAERKQKRRMGLGYLSDNVFMPTDADLSGSKGDYDPNTGIFRPDDKVISRLGRYGMELPQADIGTEFVANRYPGFDDLSADEQNQVLNQFNATNTRSYGDNYSDQYNETMNYKTDNRTVGYNPAIADLPNWMTTPGEDFSRIIVDDQMKRYMQGQLAGGNLSPNVAEGYQRFLNTYRGIPSAIDYNTSHYDRYQTFDDEKKSKFSHFGSGFGYQSELPGKGAWNTVSGHYDADVIESLINLAENRVNTSRYPDLDQDAIDADNERDFNRMISREAYNIKKEEKAEADEYFKNLRYTPIEEEPEEEEDISLYDFTYPGGTLDEITLTDTKVNSNELNPNVSVDVDEMNRLNGINPDQMFEQATNEKVGVVQTSIDEMNELNNINPTESAISLPIRNTTTVTPNNVDNTIPIIEANNQTVINNQQNNNTTETDKYTPQSIERKEYTPQSQSPALNEEVSSRKEYTPQSVEREEYTPQSQEEDVDEALYGGTFYGTGGEAEIDINTYKALIDAGADIEIL